MLQAYSGGCKQMSITDSGGIMHAMKAPARLVRAALMICLSLMVMTACSTDSHGDLSSYVQEVKARKAGRIPPLPEIKVYGAYTYKRDDLRDPFKVAEEEAVLDTAGGDGLQPDMQRNREPLESFPLDSLRFVGHMEQEGRVWAVVTAPDALVYRVEEGNYVGQSFGRIVRISESQIDIREIVPNGLGGWVERDAILTLAE